MKNCFILTIVVNIIYYIYTNENLYRGDSRGTMKGIEVLIAIFAIIYFIIALITSIDYYFSTRSYVSEVIKGNIVDDDTRKLEKLEKLDNSLKKNIIVEDRK